LRQYADLEEIQRNLNAGQLSCEAIVSDYLSQISKKSHLNAFLTVYSEEALTRASFVDTKIQNGSAGKLAGLVVGIKDVLAFKDHPLQAGSKILDGFVSQYTATAVQRLLDEDAIIIGRQNCDEFAMGSSNENSAFGPVLNDIDNTRVSGGSSGGSAVAVMADMCRVSIGSDTGGSVRQPASFCGVYGLKPTYSRISRYGLVAYGSSFDSIGIFGKSLKDVALVLQVISGSDEFDSTVSTTTVPAFLTKLNEPIPTFKVACFKDAIESNGLQREIKETIQSKISALRQLNHQVDIIDFPLTEFLLPTYYILATAEASSNLSRFDGVRYGHRSHQTTDLQSMYKKSRSEGFGKEVQRRILLGTFVLSASYYDAYYTKAQKVRRIIRDKTKELFSKYDFILSPTAPTTAFKIGENSDDPVQMYLADIYSVHANVAGIPGISVPCGVDKTGLPIGLQLMANDFEESKLFQFAELLSTLH
jgi:aspartyl-tRNA(Asn)/glutamyl-tRNA(Gln) amidotransferase subunit A